MYNPRFLSEGGGGGEASIPQANQALMVSNMQLNGIPLFDRDVKEARKFMEHTEI